MIFFKQTIQKIKTRINFSSFFSTQIDPSNSKSNATSTIQSIQCSSSRLRVKAGLPSFQHSNTNNTENISPSELAIKTPDNMFRNRTQLERTQMSYKERLIALELLEDLGIPIEEIQNDSSNSIHPLSESPIHHLLQKPEFQSVLLQKQSSSKKSLLRHQPTQLSPEEIRLEDILKELTDSHIQKMDSFETDFQLLNWVDKVVFSQSRQSTSNNLAIQTNSKSSVTDEDPTNETTNRLGQVFEKQNQDYQLKADLEDELDYIQNPDTILNQPLCFTPLFSPILLHLIKLTCSKLKNPYLALYLFNWARSHPDPIVKYFGLTKETYFENLKIKWDYFKDFKGIKNDLIEMNDMGLEFDERFKHFIQSITREVWEDELNIENNISNNSSIKFHNVSPEESRHVSQIESILDEFIESQDMAFARKLRALPAESN